jgi:hypothetical protein
MGVSERRSQSAALAALLLWYASTPPVAALAGWERPGAKAVPEWVVSEAQVLAAMRKCVGFDLTATANNPRLQAEVLLDLIQEGEQKHPARRLLRIDHDDWYRAFLERTGLSPDHAPLAARVSEELGQDIVVDYRREDVVEAVLEGPQPVHAADVWVFWLPGSGRPSEYSYDDTRSHPALRVTQERVIRYRLVDYGDRLWYADIQGLHGRPLSGSLGLLFAVIGQASVVESRSALASDGTQVVEGRARKWGFHRSQTMTVFPSGRTVAGVPEGRHDLAALAARLQEPLAIRFRPMPKDPPPPPDPVAATTP